MSPKRRIKRVSSNKEPKNCSAIQVFQNLNCNPFNLFQVFMSTFVFTF